MQQSLLHVLYTISFILLQAEAFQVASWPRIARPPKRKQAFVSSSLSMVLKESFPPSNTLSPTQIEKKIAKLGRSGRTDEALALYYSQEVPTLRQMNSAIDACSRARPTRLEECSSILKNGIESYSLKPNVFTFGALMSACSRARRADRAIQVLRDMVVCCFVYSGVQ